MFAVPDVGLPLLVEHDGVAEEVDPAPVVPRGQEGGVTGAVHPIDVGAGGALLVDALDGPADAAGVGGEGLVS